MKDFVKHAKCVDMCRMRSAALSQSGDDWLECGDACTYLDICERLFPEQVGTPYDPANPLAGLPHLAKAVEEYRAQPRWRRRVRQWKWNILDWWDRVRL